MWLTSDASLQTHSSFWMRVVSQLHYAGLIDAPTLEREMSAIADDPTIAPHVLHRTIATQAEPVTLVLDNVGSSQADTYWNAVCADIIEALRMTPLLRCIVSGRFPTALEGPSARSIVDVSSVNVDQMLFTSDETRELVDHHGDFLSDSGRDVVCGLDSSSQPMSLRYTLETLRQAPEQARQLGLDGASLPSFDLARLDMLGRVQDPQLLDFLGATALSPLVDSTLARQLTGRPDSQELLDSLETSGLGQWSQARDALPVFRYSEHIRVTAATDFAGRRPGKLKELHRAIARWLFEKQDEKIPALEHAVKAGDLEFASHVLLRTYPMSDEDRTQVGNLLDGIPAHHIHRHPLLALRYALILNAREHTQARALEYLVSSSAVGRLRASSVPQSETAIRTGIESAVWRLLGQDKRMAKRAAETVISMERSLRAEDRDESLEWVSLQSLHHSGISLIYAGDYRRARDAFSLLEEVALRQQRTGFANAAYCALAMIGVLIGDFDDASRHLDRIDPTAWPQPWATGYMASLGYIAQAWVHLNAGRPTEALASLDVLDPHAATIEHWDLMLGARVLAESMIGRVHEAQFTFERTRTARVTRRTLASSRARVAIIEGLVNIGIGTPRPVARGVTNTAAASLGHALDVIVYARHGASSDAHAHLAEAESTAISHLDEAFVAIAGAIASAQDASKLPAERYTGRLRVLLTEHDLRWPLALIPPSVRTTIATNEDGRHDHPSLGAAFMVMPALLADNESASIAVPKLTSREREILRAMALIESRTELAAHLYVSINTVKTQLRSLYSKLGVNNRDEALEMALKYGFIDRSDNPED